jgi:hypothetical protein
MLQQLHAFFSNPKAFFENYKHSTPIKAGLFMLYLSSVSLASLSSLSVNHLWSLSIITFIVLNCLLFVQSVTLDFLAQALKLTPKSYALYFWLCLSLSPLCLLPAFSTVHLPIATPFTLAIISCQLWVLKNQYNTSLKKAAALYILPLILPIIGFIFISLTL